MKGSSYTNSYQRERTNNYVETNQIDHSYRTQPQNRNLFKYMEKNPQDHFNFDPSMWGKKPPNKDSLDLAYSSSKTGLSKDLLFDNTKYLGSKKEDYRTSNSRNFIPFSEDYDHDNTKFTFEPNNNLNSQTRSRHSARENDDEEEYTNSDSEEQGETESSAEEGSEISSSEEENQGPEQLERNDPHEKTFEMKDTLEKKLNCKLTESINLIRDERLENKKLELPIKKNSLNQFDLVNNHELRNTINRLNLLSKMETINFGLTKIRVSSNNRRLDLSTNNSFSKDLEMNEERKQNQQIKADLERNIKQIKVKILFYNFINNHPKLLLEN